LNSPDSLDEVSGIQSQSPPSTTDAGERAARSEILLRKEAAFENLSKGIARLAIALGLDLETDLGLRNALKPERYGDAHKRQGYESLRGLLTLRYQMEKQLVEEMGTQAMHQIVVDVEAHMERIGFRHGVDGIHQEQLFD
jgi:hypothetical protein